MAVKRAYERHGECCDITDALAFASPKVSAFISDWHVRLYRHSPRVFSKGYQLMEEHPLRPAEEKMLARFLRTAAEKLYDCLVENGYEAVLCPHMFSGLILKETFRRYGLRLPSGFVATDYTCSPMVQNCDTDLFFIPDKALTGEFLRAGIPAEKIVPVGIPVKEAFLSQTDKVVARQALGITGRRHLLMMCGSMGCGPMEELASRIVQRLPDDAALTVVCGSNRRLQEALNDLFGTDGRIHVCGFTDQVPLLMDSADVYITKPGGLSVTEALAKRLPMVLVNAVAGCETPNLHFFTSRGMAVTADTTERLAESACALLADEERCESIRAVMLRHAIGDPSEKIYAYMAENGK